MNDWQLIATYREIPGVLMDEVLLYWPYRVRWPVVGQCVNGVWMTEKWLGDDAADPGPTHWMPLPEVPR